jgi:hypothetical protein
LKETPDIWEIFFDNDAKNYVFALGTPGKDEG